MKFSVLASGSRANCTYVEAGAERLLIDCGLSAKQCEGRLRLLDLDPAQLTGILVTHEHRDHIGGISVLSRRYGLPVYANVRTSSHLERIHELRIFRTNERFELAACSLYPFGIVHDAADPVGFAIESEGLKLVYAADLGKATPLVQDAVRLANALILESNHDPILLRDCHYPWELKQRIASTHGHLENQSAAELAAGMLHDELQYVVLAHLSENSNTPETALETFRAFISELRLPKLFCAGAAAPTELFELRPCKLPSAING